jgi:hypothetical protein
MKKLIVFVSIVFIVISNSFKLKGQNIDLQLNPSIYDNGYNVRCNGSGTGSVEAIVPFNGAMVQLLKT